jgi:ankyrin repeat protein
METLNTPSGGETSSYSSRKRKSPFEFEEGQPTPKTSRLESDPDMVLGSSDAESTQLWQWICKLCNCKAPLQDILAGKAVQASSATPVEKSGQDPYWGKTIRRGSRIGKNRTFKNFNMQVELDDKSAGDDNIVVCAHLAYAYATDEDVLDTHFQSADGIAEFFRQSPSSLAEIAKEVDRLSSEDGNRKLITNTEFGRFMVDILHRMAHDDRDNLSIMLSTNEHAMALRIKAKPQDDKEARYHFSLFDPNLTGLIKKVKLPASSPDSFEYIKKYQFTDFFNGLDTYYGSEIEENQAWVVATPLHMDMPGDKTAYADPASIGLQQSLMAAATGNLPELVQNLHSIAKQLPPEELLDVLCPQTQEHDSPALFMAAHNGHGGVVRAIGEMAKELHLSTEQVMTIVEAKDQHEMSAFFTAAQNGHGGAVKAIGEVVNELHLSAKQAMTIVEAKNGYGTPALSDAVLNGRSRIVEVILEVIKTLHLSPQQATTVIEAKDDDETPALFLAAVEGHSGIVKVIGETIEALHLSAEQAMIIIEAADPSGNSALSIAVQEGHVEVVKALGDMIAAGPLSVEQALSLIESKDSQKIPAFFRAAQKGSSSVIEAYGGALQKLNIRGEAAAQLLGQEANGETFVRLAARAGNIEALESFSKLLTILEVDLKQHQHLLESGSLSKYGSISEELILSAPSS